MKKKLEAELISIAHRILKLKNKSDVIALHQETQKLYEKLSVLRFVEESYGEAKPTIGAADIESHLEDYFDKQPETLLLEEEFDHESETAKIGEINSESVTEVDQTEETSEENQVAADSEVAEVEKPEVEVSEAEQEIIDDTNEAEAEPTETETSEIPEIEATDHDDDDKSAEAEKEVEIDQEQVKEEDDVEAEEEIELRTESEPEQSKSEVFIPAFELSFDKKSDEPEEVKTEAPTSPQFSFDDLLGKDYADPVFVKPDDVRTEKKLSDYTYKDAETIKSESRAMSLNDRLSKGITIGLNDRIAFIKHLFGDSSEDYNRVLSQLMTFGTFEEARNFIDDMIKPDYNDWQGKDEYAERFMDIVEKRFT